jgi:hypothetical protein
MLPPEVIEWCDGVRAARWRRVATRIPWIQDHAGLVTTAV